MEAVTWNVVINVLSVLSMVFMALMGVGWVFVFGYKEGKSQLRSLPNSNCIDEMECEESGAITYLGVNVHTLTTEQAVIYSKGVRDGVDRYQAEMLKEMHNHNRIIPPRLAGDYIHDPNYPDISDVKEIQDLIRTTNAIVSTKQYIDRDE